MFIRIAHSILFMLVVSIAGLSQPQSVANPEDQTSKISIIIEHKMVRFLAQGEAQEWRLEVTNQQGQLVFDSGFVSGAALEWPLKNQQDEPIQSGLYAYTLTIKAATDEKARTQRGQLIVDRASSSDRIWLTSTPPVGIGADSQVPQVTVVGSREATLGGAQLPGGVARGETGVDHPQSPKRAGEETASEKSASPASVNGTADRVAKFASDGVSLIDSAISEVGGNVGIGTAAPQSGLDYRHNSAAVFTRDVGTANPLIPQSVLQLGVSNTGSRNVNVGSSFLFFGENSAGAKSFLGRLSGAWEDPTQGSEAGSIRFQVRANSGDTTASTERMRITASGNVGIGNAAPTFRLHVVDTGNTGLRVQTNTGGGTLASFGGFGDFLIDAVNVPGGRMIVKENGKVGIGKPIPEFKLDVFSETGAIRGEANAGHAVFGVSHGSSGIASGVIGISDAGRGVAGSTDTGVAVQAYVAANQPGLFMAGSIFNGPRKFHITNDGTYIAGSDFAEALPASKGKADYAPGDVLVLSGETPGTVEKASRPYDRRVAGVYSTRPGVLGADKQGTSRVDPNDLPVAILGIVPTKVSTENGPVRVGDLLTTSSTPGYAMKASPVRVGRAKVYRTGAILGKALEPLKEGKGVIKVLVTLR